MSCTVSNVIQDDDWGDDEEWEWDEGEEEDGELEDSPEVSLEQPLTNGTGTAINDIMSVDVKTNGGIMIQGNILRINTDKKAEWSDDEYENEPQIPLPPPPPPPPPLLAQLSKVSAGLKKVVRPEGLKRRSSKRPDWNELMQEIEGVRNGKIKLRKTVSNDRSRPVLSKVKVQGQFMFESENRDTDILKEIEGGIKLKHVKTDDRSKPNLKGIRQFRRQTTKEDRQNQPNVDEDFDETDEVEDVDKLRDDLESMKQLIGLELRSKIQLEKENKRLKDEIEKLRLKLVKVDHHDESSNEKECQVLNLKNANIQNQKMEHHDEVIGGSEDEVEVMREEVDEARRLAEEWEAKYREMQRQMTDLDGGHTAKKFSVTSDASSGHGGQNSDVDQDGKWILHQDLRLLRSTLNNTRDKRDIAVQERKLLKERIDSLIQNIADEVEMRKNLKKEIREMNEAFKSELADMKSKERTAEELKDCYFSADELVPNPKSQPLKELDGEDWTKFDEDQDDGETLEEILKAAGDADEDSQGYEFLADCQTAENDSDSDADCMTDNEDEAATEAKIIRIQKKIAIQIEQVDTMRHINFLMKSRIDRLFDILQIQKEKHRDIKQELSKTLSDIQ